MPTFTADDLRELARRRELPTVSLLMPVHPGSPQEQRGDPLRFQALLDRARADLLSLGKKAGEADAILEPGKRLLDDPYFWKQAGDGLAVYLGEDWSRVFRVPTVLPELVTVNEEPHLVPLMGLVQHDGSFFVLALAANGYRLLECTRFTVKRIELDNVPATLEESSSVHEQRQPNMQVGSRTPRFAGGSILYSQGFGQEDRKTNDLKDWFLALDGAMRPHLAGRNVPLVFAGVERSAAIFATVCTHPFLTNSAVRGDAKTKTDEELRDAAWAIVRPIYEGEIRHHLQRFLHRRGDTYTSNQLDEVLSAAAEGRVDTLFVAEGSSVFGRFDADAGRLEVHDDEQPGDVDLVNEAATLAFTHGANVFAVPKGDLPERDHEVNALMRW